MRIFGQKYNYSNEETNTFSYLCDMKKVNFNISVPQELHLDYIDKYIALQDNIYQVKQTQEAVYNDSFIIILVEEGESSATINDREYSLTKGDVMICPPGNILKKGVTSSDFHCLVFICSSYYRSDILKRTQMSLSTYLMGNDVIVLKLNQAEMEMTAGFYRLIAAHNQTPHDNIREQSILHILQSFAYIISGFFLHRGFTQIKPKGTSAESLFRNFCHLLKEHTTGRSVQFFANKLNISPKYLNNICKQISGKTASTLINEETIKQAQAMLLDPDLSIKQISSKLGFVNQSHFGSFIRKHTGISPQALRKNTK